MKVYVSGLAMCVLLGLAGCAGDTQKPTDTGSMTQSPPYRAGVVDPTQQGRDVGSMQAPTVTGGTARVERRALDTGSMNSPQGNAGTTSLTH